MINQYDKDGMKHGQWEEYWPNGALKWRGEYKNGILHGIGIHYSIRGNITDRHTYKTGRVVLYEAYHEDGRTWMKGDCKKGSWRGLWYEEYYAK